MKSYAGIGSRETPVVVLSKMTDIARELKALNLRSGGAKGADSAFELGATHKQIFYVRDAKPWCYDLVQNYLPAGYQWSRMKPFVQGLLARNMMQILGPNGDDPSLFVIAWTKDGKDSGGSGYALRCAAAHNIPIFNLYNNLPETPWLTLL